ncbi:hypothetical protein AC578_8765 [Pseudocercospora eumusae]|uniref:Uncharacterized protein n=1 Tax=Pseudocercospora eumusae TaxID=321146 RepID=A0A139H6A9_9PEZI|nr:hypothetical protein AC578_8765 [Pseudocercospora eumusae]
MQHANIAIDTGTRLSDNFQPQGRDKRRPRDGPFANIHHWRAAELILHHDVAIDYGLLRGCKDASPSGENSGYNDPTHANAAVEKLAKKVDGLLTGGLHGEFYEESRSSAKNRHH